MRVFAMRHDSSLGTIICSKPINRTFIPLLYLVTLRYASAMRSATSRKPRRFELFRRNIGLFVYADAINPINISREDTMICVGRTKNRGSEKGREQEENWSLRDCSRRSSSATIAETRGCGCSRMKIAFRRRARVHVQFAHL